MQKIIRKHKAYMKDANTEALLSAYEFAQIAYHGEKRLDGSDWLEHALNVTRSLVDLQMDTATLCAALLHDVYDFGVKRSDVEEEFDEVVADMLDSLHFTKGLSKKYRDSLGSAHYSDLMRRVVIAASKDLRVVSIRVAEKLHDLETSHLLDEKQRQISLTKALNLYAPLADFIGLPEYKSKIEDIAFKHKHPNEYEVCRANLNEHKFSGIKERILFEREIKKLLEAKNIKPVKIYGRTKTPYSLYKKTLRRVGRLVRKYEDAFDLIHDKVGITILAATQEDCYKALDILHNAYSYVPDAFDDYISQPRGSGYKSLQTTLNIEGNYIEVQIKTPEMHEYNEYGPASHVFYKIYGPDFKVGEEKIVILRRLLKWREDFLQDFSKAQVDDLENTIFVFTPKADIIELPKGATTVDFAYEIHTEVGDKIARALVNGTQKPLDHVLQSGDIVEVMVDKNRRYPSADWLRFVKTKNAAFHIRRNLKR